MGSLHDLDASYDTTDAAERKGGGPLPDGTYQVRIDKVKMDETSNGNPSLELEVVVAVGQHTGHRHWVNRTITMDTLPHVKADLSILGWGNNKLSDLEDHGKIATLLDRMIEIRIVTKGTKVYKGKEHPDRRTYINRSLGNSSNPGPQGSSQGSSRGPVAGPGSTVSRTIKPRGGTADDEPPF